MTRIADDLTVRAAADRRPMPRRGLVAALAVAVPVMMWLAAQVMGVELRSPAFGAEPVRAIGAGQVLLVSAAAVLAGWALLAGLERVTRHGRLIWRITAVAVLALSLGGPLSGTGISAATRVTLVLMHVSLAVVLVPLLPRAGRSVAESTAHQ